MDSIKRQLEDTISDLRSKLRTSQNDRTDVQEQLDAATHELTRVKKQIAEIDKLKKKVKDEKEKRKRNTWDKPTLLGGRCFYETESGIENNLFVPFLFLRNWRILTAYPSTIAAKRLPQSAIAFAFSFA